MGRSCKKIYGLSLALAAMAFLCPASFGASEDAGTSAVLDNFILPEYRKADNRLQCILYGDKAVNLGAIINLKNPLVDIVQDEIKNINDVKNLQGTVLYPIEEPTPSVRKFWSDKTHSKALISSTTAQYDRTSKLLKGDDIVHFRSPGIDIDGVGFDADNERKFIHIRSKVRVIVRPEMRNGVEPSKQAPEAPAAETKNRKD